MCEQERWLEIAETMTFEVAFEAAAKIEATETTEQAETVQAAETIEPEMIETTPEPRTARVLSISQLRQKLGIGEVEQPVARPPPPAPGRPRIVKRRCDVAMQEPELLAG